MVADKGEGKATLLGYSHIVRQPCVSNNEIINRLIGDLRMRDPK